MNKILKSIYFRSVAWTLVLTIGSWTPMEAIAATHAGDYQRQLQADAAKRGLLRVRGSRQSGVRALSDREMRGVVGRGQYRKPFLCGTMPWHRSFRDVNLCTGNLMKSFTDIQVAPGRGAGLVLQRTYNSNDDRVGPFGHGWTHAYEIRMDDCINVAPGEAGADDLTVRTDFFGGKHKYHRDADGLYTPDLYMHNWTESTYDDVLEQGPQPVVDDIEIDLDETTKHYTKIGTSRVCDYIKDRHGNYTELIYDQQTGRLDMVVVRADPQIAPGTAIGANDRVLEFTWSNVAPQGHDPAYRVTRVEFHLGTSGSALQQVDYEYYTSDTENGAGGEAYNLKAAYVAVGGSRAPRTTLYAYASYEGPDDTENGLLSSIKSLIDANANPPEYSEVQYTYSAEARTDRSLCQPANGLTYTGSVWVTQIQEPAGEDDNGDPRSITWDVFSSIGCSASPSPLMGHVEHNPDGVVSDDDICIFVRSDENMRAVLAWQGYDYRTDGFSSNWIYKTEYDDYNNPVRVSRSLRSGYRDPENSYNYSRPMIADCYEYGQFGKPLRHWVEGFLDLQGHPKYDTYQYYTEDKYFQTWKVTDVEGNTTEYDYFDRYDTSPGNKGNVKWVRDARYGATGEQYEYLYNDYGQKTQETNLNNVITTFGYSDDWGNLSQVIQDPGDYPQHLSRTTDMIYDESGRVTMRCDPNGDYSFVTYNLVGQPLEATYLYENIDYSYRDDGSMASVTDGRGTTSIDYEKQSSRVSSVTDPVTGTMSYEYNPRGSVTKKTLPDGGEWTYDYRVGDPTIGGLGSKGNPDDFTEDLWRISYKGSSDPAPMAVVLGVNDDDPVHDYSTGSWFYNLKYTRGQDEEDQEDDVLLSYCRVDNYVDGVDDENMPTHGWLTQTDNWFFPQEGEPWLISRNVYSYYDSGNRASNTATVRDTSGNLQSWTQDYGYDELYRLMSVDYGGGNTEAYTFDPMGNRLSVNGTTYGYNAANMLTTIGGQLYATYDANGNQLTGGWRTNTWDTQNRLVQCIYGSNTSTFEYGSDGLRRRMAVDDGQNTVTTDYVLDGQSVVREFKDESPSATYLVGPRGVEYRQDDTTGERKWYVYDGLGSVLAEVDENGYVDACRSYDVWGNPLWNEGSPLSSHWFVGGLGHTMEDSTGGLIYMRARWYDPGTGRFVSEDPAKDGNNWYVYCAGNPVNSVDDTGESVWWHTWATVWAGAAKDVYAAAQGGIAGLEALMAYVPASEMVFWFERSEFFSACAETLTIMIDIDPALAEAYAMTQSSLYMSLGNALELIGAGTAASEAAEELEEGAVTIIVL